MGEINLYFQKYGKEPVDKDKLNRYNSRAVNTNSQFQQKILGTMSGPELNL